MVVMLLLYIYFFVIRCFFVFLFKDVKLRGMCIFKKRKIEKVKKEINGEEEMKVVSEVILYSIVYVILLKIVFKVVFECMYVLDIKVGISLYLVIFCNNVFCVYCFVLFFLKFFWCLFILKVFW